MDSLKRIFSRKLNIRAYTADTKITSSEIIRLKDTSPTSSYILGQSINAAALLSSSLKPESDQNLTFKIECSGPLKSLSVQIDAYGNIRAMISGTMTDELSGKIDVSKALGAGMISVIKDIGMKEPYTGVSHIVKGDIAYDTAYYLTSSEQVPSAVLIGFAMNKNAEVTASGGILIQAFPDTDENVIINIENRITSMSSPISQRLSNGEAINDILSDIIECKDFEIMNSIPLQHKCRCSREFIALTLKSISKKEMQMMIDEDKGAEIKCGFCESAYNFSAKELTEIISQSSSEA